MTTEIVAVTQAGMQADVERLRSISQNLANASTLGYKREIVVTRPFAAMVDASIPVASSATDHSTGSLKYTGSPLDVSAQGDVFFVVRTDNGEALTRQGNFRLDNAGRLISADGAPVMGTGGEIRLTSPTPRIDADGTIWEGTTQVGALRLARVADPAQLQNIGNGMYALANGSITDATDGRVRQGYVEAANTVAMDEMIRMIETVRHFEASQRLLRGYDDMLDKAINSLGEV